MSVLGWSALAAALLLAPAPAAAASARHRMPLVPAARPRLGLPVVCAAAAVALAGLLGGWPGAVAGVPAAAGLAWLVARSSRARGAARPPEARSVAFAVDLLAGALAAGAPPELAIAGVAAAAEHGPATLRHAVQPLSRVGRLLQLGSDPAVAWAVLQPVPGYGPVADCGRRCAGSGARLADALAGVAAELRAAHHADSLARAERVGVWSLLPLGLCFLPAFVCIGVLPVVLGVAGEVLGGVPR